MAQAIRRGSASTRPLILSALLIAGTLALTTMPPFGSGAERIAGQALASRDLLFADRADGGVTVTDARDGALVGILAPGEDGFVRGAMRGLVRERRIGGLGAETPFRVTGWSDGRLTLEDLATGKRIELGAFGAENRVAFSQLLSAATGSST